MASNSMAQQRELQKVRDDFFRAPCRQYQPDDPCNRSKLWAKQVGHRWAFYNCDGEEDKRYSPYICWKTPNGTPLPRPKGLRTHLRCDLMRMFQRIEDGACGCNENVCGSTSAACDCPKCTKAAAMNGDEVSGLEFAVDGGSNGVQGQRRSVVPRAEGLISAVPYDQYQARLAEESPSSRSDLVQEIVSGQVGASKRPGHLTPPTSKNQSASIAKAPGLLERVRMAQQLQRQNVNQDQVRAGDVKQSSAQVRQANRKSSLITIGPSSQRKIFPINWAASTRPHTRCNPAPVGYR